MIQLIKNYYHVSQRHHHTCRNCGETGHLYKSCPKPIMSFGIICYRKNGDNLEYLMIQRRDSLSFMEFIRGKYQLSDVEYIKRLMSNMTLFERNLLLTEYFDDLWNKIWYQSYTPKQTQDYLEAKDRFIKLKQGYMLNNVMINMYQLLNQVDTKYSEPEWGFPKGRRRLKEKDTDCALREFCEETGFQKYDIEMCNNMDAYEEIFYGTNDIQYRHVYYIATIGTNPFKEVVIDPDNLQQVREVRQIQWFTYDEVMHRIRNHNVERKELFTRANQQLCNLFI